MDGNPTAGSTRGLPGDKNGPRNKRESTGPEPCAFIVDLGYCAKNFAESISDIGSAARPGFSPVGGWNQDRLNDPLREFKSIDRTVSSDPDPPTAKIGYNRAGVG